MKKIRIIDVTIVLCLIAALVVGFLTYMHFRQTADKQIEATKKIQFQVFLRGVTITSGVCPIRPNDKTFISIRNVPYTDLNVVDVKADAKKILMPNPEKNPAFIVLNDYSQLFMFDIIVTVEDTAKITKDGAVVGGNKIKIGLPITLEGKDYKFNGTVSNVQIIEDAKAVPQMAIPFAPNPQNTNAQPPVMPGAVNSSQPQPPMPTQPQPQFQPPQGMHMPPPAVPKQMGHQAPMPQPPIPPQASAPMNAVPKGVQK